MTGLKTARGYMMEQEARERVHRTWQHRHDLSGPWWVGPYCPEPYECPPRTQFETLPAVARMMDEIRKPLVEILG